MAPQDKLVRVYEALTVADAQDLADRLTAEGIEAFADMTDAPIDALTRGPSSKILRVRRADAPAARRIVKRFEAEGKIGLRASHSEVDYTGGELSTEQRPSTDSPSADIEGAGVERLDMDRPGPDSPELEGMHIESPHHFDNRRDVVVGNSDIQGIGPDQDLAHEAEVESDEVQDAKFEDLDLSHLVDEPETRTPAANLKSGNPTGKPKGKKRRKQ